MLIAVVGADGAGKSTVTAAVRARMAAAGYPARVVDRWDIVDNPAYPTARFLRPDVRDLRSCVALMANPSRFLFLMWASALALSDPYEGLTFLDGYWMKHAASEVAYGLDPAWVESVAHGLPKPDLTVHLRLSPELAWQRKGGQPYPYECGMDLTRSRPSFLAHQGRIGEVLDGWADRDGWYPVDASQPLETVVSSVVETL
jgi:thymidylate kinase